MRNHDPYSDCFLMVFQSSARLARLPDCLTAMVVTARRCPAGCHDRFQHRWLDVHRTHKSPVTGSYLVLHHNSPVTGSYLVLQFISGLQQLFPIHFGARGTECLLNLWR